jgi:hypothetical protein
MSKEKSLELLFAKAIAAVKPDRRERTLLVSSFLNSKNAQVGLPVP